MKGRDKQEFYFNKSTLPQCHRSQELQSQNNIQPEQNMCKFYFELREKKTDLYFLKIKTLFCISYIVLESVVNCNLIDNAVLWLIIKQQFQLNFLQSNFRVYYTHAGNFVYTLLPCVVDNFQFQRVIMYDLQFLFF